MLLDVNKKRLIQTFTELAEISSPSWGEQKLADIIAKRLKSLGLTVTSYPCGNSVNLLATLPSDEQSFNRKAILFAAHMDTVSPCENVQPVVSANRITSDGTTVLGGDDKAAIAAFIEAISVIKEKKIPHGHLEFLFTCAEEIGLQGAKGFDVSVLKSKIGFVMDCDGDVGGVIVKAPYDYAPVTIKVKGKAAHAGMAPEKGVNAIFVLSNIIARLPNGRIDNETTFNVGKISGGTVTNIVPDTAECVLEMRSISRAKINAVFRQTKEIAATVAAEMGAKVTVSKSLAYGGFSMKEKDLPLMIADRALRRLHIEPTHKASGGGSDANVFNKAGIKCVNLACGMSNIHTTSEYLPIEQLVRAAMLAVALVVES